MNAPSVITSLDKPISIAILAMGGQGGGVLTDWIVAVAEANGWHAQSTSVPGVAQRTGATLYYIEMLTPRDGKAPVLALMPTPGDVDIVIAAELMEAGRSILRGLATPDKTLLITSTHRSFAVAEKEKPGGSIADPRAVDAAAGIAARRVIAFDMEAAARRNGTVISAPMLGALAGSGVLPFARQSFEAIVEIGGKGVSASLKGFAEGHASANENALPSLRIAPRTSLEALPDSLGSAALDALLKRVKALPAPARPFALAGLKRVIDFQDVQYGAEYLGKLEDLARLDSANRAYAFSTACAKYLATAMAYDDVIGVADLKTRSRRFARIEREMNSGGDPVYFTEFMHPRAEELASLLPARLGRSVLVRPRLMQTLDRLFNRGRHVETAKLAGFMQLYAISSLRRFRRNLLRHANEMAHMERWLALAKDHVATNYGLAVGIIKSRRLIKGYSDTHARGLSKFDRVLSAAPRLAARHDAGQWMDRLIAAALKDEDGDMLDGALRTVREM
jgi:indolepyruvate ferredoxin oxidoreductase beta subunit